MGRICRIGFAASVHEDRAMSAEAIPLIPRREGVVLVFGNNSRVARNALSAAFYAARFDDGGAACAGERTAQTGYEL